MSSSTWWGKWVFSLRVCLKLTLLRNRSSPGLRCSIDQQVFPTGSSFFSKDLLWKESPLLSRWIPWGCAPSAWRSSLWTRWWWNSTVATPSTASALSLGWQKIVAVLFAETGCIWRTMEDEGGKEMEGRKEASSCSCPFCIFIKMQ